jgi:hypothetical protein
MSPIRGTLLANRLKKSFGESSRRFDIDKYTGEICSTLHQANGYICPISRIVSLNSCPLQSELVTVQVFRQIDSSSCYLDFRHLKHIRGIHVLILIG